MNRREYPNCKRRYSEDRRRSPIKRQRLDDQRHITRNTERDRTRNDRSDRKRNERRNTSYHHRERQKHPRHHHNVYPKPRDRPAPQQENNALNILKSLAKDEQESTDALLALLSQKSVFEYYEQHVIHDSSHVELLLKVLTKACKSDCSPENLRQLLTSVNNSKFLKPDGPLLTYIISKPLTADVVIAVSSIAEALLHTLAHTSQATVVQLMSYFNNFQLDADQQDRRQQRAVECLHTVNDLLKNVTRGIKKANVTINVAFSHSDGPPNDYRTIPLIPTAVEISAPNEPLFLQKNIVHGSYRDVNHYLDVQYRLLREDFVCSLREGLKVLVDNKKAFDHVGRLSDIRYYKNVKILTPYCTQKSLVYRVSFDISQLTRVRWENSKRLLVGSLVALSSDDFKNIIFATVTDRSVGFLREGIVDLRFEQSSSQFIDTNSFTNYEMIESSSAYFESYRHVLARLQEITTGQLPFEKYLLNQNGDNNDVGPPRYLQRSLCSFDFSCIIPDDNSKSDVRQKVNVNPLPNYDITFSGNSSIIFPQACQSWYQRMAVVTEDAIAKVPILDLKAWPSAAHLGLDESQYSALQTALTKEFAVIQGPPGTGKTFIGLKLVQLLLSNASQINDSGCKILIVCYTNHALDQFLEGIISECPFSVETLIRLGARSKSANDKLLSRNLFNVRKQDFRSLNRVKAVQNAKEVIKDVESKMSELQYEITRLTAYVECARTWLIHEKCLLSYITQKQYESLKKQSYSPSSDSLLATWLNGELVDVNQILESSNLNVDGDKNKNTTTSVKHCNMNRMKQKPKPFDQKKESFDQIKSATLECHKEIAVLVSPNVPEEGEIFDTGHWDCAVLKDREHVEVMSNEEAQNVPDVWSLSSHNRWRLYNRWVSDYCRGKTREIYRRSKEYNKLASQLLELKTETDYQVLKRAKVIGITTTGAAKYRHLIQRVNPKIVIVEEAAEVLEAHIVTTLPSRCEHLIMIGDHKQLRPNPSVYRLAKDYHLNISLFERMVKNNLHCDMLTTQHRMRPEMAKLLVPHIYKSLINHSSVLSYENIQGVKRNVFFIDHSEPENNDDDSKTHSNEHEVQFLIGLCRYLLRQGYRTSQITILTPYTGQMFLFRRHMPKSEFADIRVTPVDNYQGEENDIILLSLVRSNMDRKVGFLGDANRVCVSLSRAKKGLFVIGNLTMLSQCCQVWNRIVQQLKSDGSLVTELPLLCHKHPDRITLVKCDKDFCQVPEGGCSLDCGFRLDCGHTCAMKCHPTDHENYKCRKPCSKVCNNQHSCSKLCYEECGECQVTVEKTIPACGHVQKMKCSQSPECFICLMPCEKKLLSCDIHPCQRKCGEDCDKLCNFIIPDRKWPCGHVHAVECWLNPDNYRCTVAVKKLLPCDHEAMVPCHLDPDQHACTANVIKLLSCGHQAEVSCSVDPAQQRCTTEVQLKLCENENHIFMVSCHSRQHKTHPEKCNRCIRVSCPRDMKHVYIVRCHERNEARCPIMCNCKLECGQRCQGTCGQCAGPAGCLKICNERCTRTLPCGHACSATCGATCPPCQQPCKTFCGHSLCSDLCGQECSNCEKPCLWSCQHVQCGRKCYEPCTRRRCDFWCEARLPCGHQCMGFCGEPCPPLCFTCDNLISPSGLVELQPCGHVVEAERMDRFVSRLKLEAPYEPVPVTCCLCKQQVDFCPRYNAVIKQFTLDMNAIKKALSNSDQQILESALDSFWPLGNEGMRQKLLDPSEWQPLTFTNTSHEQTVKFNTLALGAICVWQECSNIQKQMTEYQHVSRYEADYLQRARDSLEELIVLGDHVNLVRKIASLQMLYLHLNVLRLMTFVKGYRHELLVDLQDRTGHYIIPNDPRSIRYFGFDIMDIKYNLEINFSSWHIKDLDSYFQPKLLQQVNISKWLICARGHAFGVNRESSSSVQCPVCDARRHGNCAAVATSRTVDVHKIITSVFTANSTSNFDHESSVSSSSDDDM